ncbi:MAG: hypothetical protein AB7V58_13530 [Solirubrobacterales bacterium]
MKVGLAGLIAIFLALLALAAALLALALAIASARPGVGFLALWKDELMLLLSLPVDGPAANQGGAVAQGVALVGGALAVILSALYIGAIVFRIFVHPKVFVFRKKLALLPSPATFKGELDDDGHVLAIRAYNASRMRALDVRFEVIHQHWIEVDDGSVVRNVQVELANSTWPMADRHVPYTLFVCLRSGDVDRDADGLALRAIGGRPIAPRDRLVVHVFGTTPELGQEFVERHAFDLATAVSDDNWKGVQLEYGSASRDWKGWDQFDA